MKSVWQHKDKHMLVAVPPWPQHCKLEEYIAINVGFWQLVISSLSIHKKTKRQFKQSEDQYMNTFSKTEKKKKKANHVLSVSTMPNAPSMTDNIQLKISFIHKIWIAYLMILVIQKLPNKVLEKQSATMVSASTIRFLECLWPQLWLHQSYLSAISRNIKERDSFLKPCSRISPEQDSNHQQLNLISFLPCSLLSFMWPNEPLHGVILKNHF